MKEHTTVRVPGDDAIEHQHVKMHVEIQTAEALNKGYRSALRILEALALGASAVAGKDGLDEDAAQGCENVGLERRKLAKLVRERQNVLPHRDVGQDSIDQVGSRVGHQLHRMMRSELRSASCDMRGIRCKDARSSYALGAHTA